MARFALIIDGTVDNVVEVPEDVVDVTTDDQTGEVVAEEPVTAAAYAARLWPDVTLVEVTDEPVGPGWRHVAGDLVPPLRGPLLEATGELVGDGTDTVVVRYVNEQADAPAEVTFTANGATANPAPLVDGVAELTLKATRPGRVRVEADGLRLTVNAT